MQVLMLLARAALSENGWAGLIVLPVTMVGIETGWYLGRVELREKGLLVHGVLHPWGQLGKFKWVPGPRPQLSVQNPHAEKDIWIRCEPDPNVERILLEKGLRPLESE